MTDELIARLERDLKSYNFDVGVRVANVSDVVVKLAEWVNARDGGATDLALDHVVINEVELNPPGADAGNEWVELYNPTDEPVDISGWVVRTTHGVTVSVTVPSGTVLEPGSFYVVTYPEQWLDNEGERVLLLDSDGNLVDATHKLSDVENDARSWGRTPDGRADWRFARSTQGSSNGGEEKFVGTTYWLMLSSFVSNYDEGASYLGARGYDEELYELTLQNLRAAVGNLSRILYSAFKDAEELAAQAVVRVPEEVCSWQPALLARPELAVAIIAIIAIAALAVALKRRLK